MASRGGWRAVLALLQNRKGIVLGGVKRSRGLEKTAPYSVIKPAYAMSRTPRLSNHLLAEAKVYTYTSSKWVPSPQAGDVPFVLRLLSKLMLSDAGRLKG